MPPDLPALFRTLLMSCQEIRQLTTDDMPPDLPAAIHNLFLFIQKQPQKDYMQQSATDDMPPDLPSVR